jgi:hypothetical protein
VDTTEVTRFEVIDHRANGVLYLPGGGPVHGLKGRALVTGATYGPPVSVQLLLQDEGRTLKVILTDPGAELDLAAERETRPYMIPGRPPEGT